LARDLVDQLDEPLIYRDLANNPLPVIDPQDLIAVHGSADDSRESLQQHLAISNQLIDELKIAETLVIAAPMYNVGIPASIKQWIDAICSSGVRFK